MTEHKEWMSIIFIVVMCLFHHKTDIAVGFAVCYLTRLVCWSHIGECCNLLKINTVITTLNEHHLGGIICITRARYISKFECCQSLVFTHIHTQIVVKFIIITIAIICSVQVC